MLLPEVNKIALELRQARSDLDNLFAMEREAQAAKEAFLKEHFPGYLELMALTEAILEIKALAGTLDEELRTATVTLTTETGIKTFPWGGVRETTKLEILDANAAANFASSMESSAQKPGWMVEVKYSFTKAFEDLLKSLPEAYPWFQINKRLAPYVNKDLSKLEEGEE
jgi:hypothetical protein